LTESVKKDRSLFLTGAVFFLLSLRDRAFPASLWERDSLIQIALLGILAWASWTRRFRPALGAALGLGLMVAFLPWLARIRAGTADIDALLPVLIWLLVLAANARKERREVYFES
jgi:hypothetical protein